MKLNELPVTNEKLMSFHIEFKGTDSIGGERHFLEHMSLNSNASFTKEQLHRNLSMLGGSLLNACTSQERIMFSGTYLKEDEQRVWELLHSVINECSFVPEEIEKERKIILEEFRLGKDRIFSQLYVSLGKVLDKKLSVIGSAESIKGIDSLDLEIVYNEIMMGTHATMFVQNCTPPTDLVSESCIERVQLQKIVPEGNHTIENTDMSSSVVFHTFNTGFSLSALLLEDYLQSVSGPLFKKLREERQLCYMVGAMTDFCGDYELSPYFTLYVVSDSDIEQARTALLEEFVVDDVGLYDSLRTKHKLEMEENKATFGGQMGLERRSQLTGIPAFSLIDSIPTWEEFKKYSEEVKAAHMGTFKVIGTKK